MRIITRWSRLLAIGSLLVFAACGRESPEAEKVRLAKGPEKDSSVVNLDSCRADPNWVRVHKGSNVSWIVPTTDPHTYTLQFKKTPIPESTVKVSANAPDKPHRVEGDIWCTVKLGSCLYDYTLTTEGGKPCPDPGVHVIP